VPDHQQRRHTVDVGGVTLDVAETGPADGPALLLVSGLGSQRTDWPTELLTGLVAAGLRLVTVDNRDTGHSTWLEAAGDEQAELARAKRREPFTPPYRLLDLARDLVGVLDHLGLDRAHVLGQSMGGMVAQHLAAGWPERVTSLTSVMSTTGEATVGRSTREVARATTAPSPTERDAWVEANVERSRLTNSPTLFDEDRARARFAAAWDRGGVNPAGKTRQLLAILADGDRTAWLRDLRVPTLVLHGAADPVVAVDGGEATADAVAGARLLVLEEMAHDLPLPLLPVIVAAVAGHVFDAERAPKAGRGRPRH
jgi:pimeloyl-ACP methyl ester carboxylesterase